MTARKHLLKAGLAMTLAGGAIAPATASAMLPPPDPPQSANPPSVEVVQVPAHHGFDWGDAGIGAASGVGLAMLAAGGLVTAQRRARHAQ